MERPTHSDVFVSGTDGYRAYRIPALEQAADGTLLAFAEARRHNLGDPGTPDNEIDLVMKRSADGGRTWSAMSVVEAAGPLRSAGNPAPILDRRTGRIWLHYIRCVPGGSSSRARPGTLDVMNLVRWSGDAGRSWSDPADVTAACRDMNDGSWRSTVAGPGGAIQDRRGRLVVPAWRSAPGRGVFAVFSEDDGATWSRGGIVPGSDGGNEDQIVELADGRLMLDFRQTDGPTRFVAYSGDGGVSWSAPRPGRTVTRVCCAVERWTLRSAGSDADRIVWTGPRGLERTDLVARVSRDEGESFGEERLIAAGPAAYSDLALLGDGALGVLWERAQYGYITYTRLDRDFLEPHAAGG